MELRGIFVTGTDTDIGKTTVSALLLAALREQGVARRYFKPVQTGGDSDTATVARLAELEAHVIVAPVFTFPEPISPHRAAAAHGAVIGLGDIREAWEAARGEAFTVVEGAGGLLVPLNDRDSVRELVAALGLPVVIVASTRLGTINHTLLTVEAARAGGLTVVGVVLNGASDPGLDATLSARTGLPILAEVRPLPEWTPAVVAARGPAVFSREALGLVLGGRGPEGWRAGAVEDGRAP
jgi:dethiobiotin synthase